MNQKINTIVLKVW